MKNYIFDSSALISFFDKEKNAHSVATVLKEVNRNNHTSIISVINLGEIYYHFLRTSDKATADNVVTQITNLNFVVEEADWALTKKAAAIKSLHKMSYADTFAAALCKKLKGILVTSDKEFLSLKEEITIKFV